MPNNDPRAEVPRTSTRLPLYFLIAVVLFGVGFWLTQRGGEEAPADPAAIEEPAG